MNKTIAFYCQSDDRVKNDYFLDNYDDTNEYVRLTKELRSEGYKVHSLDIYKKQNITPKICIFLDIPTFNINKIINTTKTKTIGMLREAESISRVNYDKIRHKEFDAILTWKRDLIDEKKYFYFPSTRFDKSLKVKTKSYLDRKLCVLINSNLTSKIPGELYSWRLKAIKWFEKNHLENFDLWGFGWDEYRLIIRGRTIFKSKLFAQKRPSYKGTSDDKLKTMSNYKFAICFENTNVVRDYVSEKIFDCFLAGVIPIYWGAPNIDKIIPKECFIDFRKFKNFEDMYQYISNMDNEEYLEYINAMNDFLNSEKSTIFTLDNWVKSMKKTIYKLDKEND